MREEEKFSEKPSTVSDRKVVIAYLTYALEEVRALNEVSAHLLQMTIAALREELPEKTALPSQRSLYN